MSEIVRAAMAVGSNLGDRRRHLNEAIATLSAAPGVTAVAVSPIVESPAVGGPEQPVFLNAVLVVDTNLPADELLTIAQQCEENAHRVREERWGPRTLDVDVLAYDQVRSDDPALTLPHPRATERAFVMVPWAAVDPEFEIDGRTVAEWASALDRSDVRVVTEISD